MIYGKGVDDVCYNDPSDCSENEPWGSPKTINIGYPMKGWIYNEYNSENNTWLLSSNSKDSDNVFMYDRSLIYGNVGIGNFQKVLPVLYLKSNVIIESGTGKSNDPYVLK